MGEIGNYFHVHEKNPEGKITLRMPRLIRKYWKCVIRRDVETLKWWWSGWKSRGKVEDCMCNGMILVIDNSRVGEINTYCNDQKCNARIFISFWSYHMYCEPVTTIKGSIYLYSRSTMMIHHHHPSHRHLIWWQSDQRSTRNKNKNRIIHRAGGGYRKIKNTKLIVVVRAYLYRADSRRRAGVFFLNFFVTVSAP